MLSLGLGFDLQIFPNDFYSGARISAKRTGVLSPLIRTKRRTFLPESLRDLVGIIKERARGAPSDVKKVLEVLSRIKVEGKAWEYAVSYIEGWLSFVEESEDFWEFNELVDKHATTWLGPRNFMSRAKVKAFLSEAIENSFRLGTALPVFLEGLEEDSGGFEEIYRDEEQSLILGAFPLKRIKTSPLKRHSKDEPPRSISLLLVRIARGERSPDDVGDFIVAFLADLEDRDYLDYKVIEVEHSKRDSYAVYQVEVYIDLKDIAIAIPKFHLKKNEGSIPSPWKVYFFGESLEANLAEALSVALDIPWRSQDESKIKNLWSYRERMGYQRGTMEKNYSMEGMKELLAETESLVFWISSLREGGFSVCRREEGSTHFRWGKIRRLVRENYKKKDVGNEHRGLLGVFGGSVYTSWGKAHRRWGGGRCDFPGGPTGKRGQSVCGDTTRNRRTLLEGVCKFRIGPGTGQTDGRLGESR